VVIIYYKIIDYKQLLDGADRGWLHRDSGIVGYEK